MYNSAGTANFRKMDIRYTAATGYEGLYFRSINDANNDFNEIARFDTKTGDISFYEDTGTTPKFFWDASAESLGTSTSVSNNRLVIDQASGDGQNSGFYMQRNGGAGTSFKIDIDSDDVVNFRRSISTKIAINSSGNVGIGTSSPDSLLEVSGADESQIKVTGTSGVEAVLRASASTVTVGSNTAHNLYLRTSNSARMTITADGKVGIGTTSPDEALEVNGDVKISGASSGNAGVLHFGGVSDDVKIAGFDRNSSPTNSMLFYTNTAERMRIDSSGNVGIGTSSPTAKLHVGAVSNIVGNLSPTAVIIGDINTSGSEETTLGIYQGGTSVGSAVGLVAGVTSGASPYFAIKTRPTAGGDSIERLRIDSSGTTSLRNAPAGNALQFGTTSSGTYTERARVGINASNGLDFAVNGTSPDVTINTSGYVGIGTSSPTNQLHITATNPTVYLETSGGGATDSAFVQKFSNDFYIWNKEVAGKLFLGTNNSTKLTIDSSGNVGIGTSSPTEKFHVVSDDGLIAVQSANGNTVDAIMGGYMIYSADGSGPGPGNRAGIASYIMDTFGVTYDLRFYTSNSSSNLNEAMRIDSDGNVHVGGTSEAGTGQVSLNGSGYIKARKNNVTGIFDRITTDGDIVQFRKDGTTVGSIGTVNGDMYLGTGDTGLFFSDGANYIMPYNLSTLSPADGLLDLGRDTNRFKDLYLSGGVYLGGTGAANKLDDYETGTWTPTTTTNGFTQSISSYSNATYVKIGKLVYIKAQITLSSSGYASGLTRISGLPFSANTFGTGVYTSATVSGGAKGNLALILTGTSQLYLHIDSTTVDAPIWYVSGSFEVA
jgi:hypothetical protein